MTQQRCALGKVAATVIFTESMSLTLKKDNFLSNPRNKQCFFDDAESGYTECRLCDCDGDTDLLIVKTAVESA